MQTSVQTLINIIDYQMDIQEAMNTPMWRIYYPNDFSKDTLTTNQGMLSLDERILPKSLTRLKELGWDTMLEKEFTNNPDCIIMKDPKKGTLTAEIPFNRSGTIFAW